MTTRNSCWRAGTCKQPLSFFHCTNIIKKSKLFKNENGHDVAKDNADEVGAAGAHKGGSDLACLCAQMAARNAAAKTCTLDSERWRVNNSAD
jgi:hypothetical protein